MYTNMYTIRIILLSEIHYDTNYPLNLVEFRYFDISHPYLFKEEGKKIDIRKVFTRRQ